MSSFFELQRFKKMIIWDVAIHGHQFLVKLLLFAASLIFIPLILKFFGLSLISHQLYTTVAILCLGIHSSFSILEQKRRHGLGVWLNIPCSNFEKWFSLWLITACVFPTILYIAYLVTLSTLSLLFSDIQDFLYVFKTHFLLEPKLILHYLGLHALFFFGAFMFKRFLLFKTIFSFIGIYVVLVFLSQCIFAYADEEIKSLVDNDLILMMETLPAAAQAELMDQGLNIAMKSLAVLNVLNQLLFSVYLYLAPLCLLGSYFCFKEKTV